MSVKRLTGMILSVLALGIMATCVCACGLPTGDSPDSGQQSTVGGSTEDSTVTEGDGFVRDPYDDL